MKQGIGFFIITIYCIFIIIISTHKILIGLNRINHPMYDNDLKRKHIFKHGIIGLIIGVVCGLPFMIWSIMIIFMEY